MKKYSPGASVKSDYAVICDYCEVDDGRPVVLWDTLPDREGHFALCRGCLSKLYMMYSAPQDKKGETIIVKRQTIPEKLRTKIFKRDKYKCVDCGSEENLQIDHIIPFIVGGETVKSNLQTLCRTCNLSKRDK